ncbi:MAG: hypothetical protein IKV57_06725 [Clostridia bacterium]|nr:hypothetical protein [Clostridia bacterium]
MKRFFGFILFFCTLLCCLFLSGCRAAEVSETVPPETVPVSAAAETDPLVYVSLGDSIARGYGLDNISGERFSTVTAGIWEEDGPVDVYNYGVDGQTSTELLEMLAEATLPGLAEADVVSVSIGANNVLRSGFRFLREYYLYLYADPPQFTDDSIAEAYRTFTAEADAGCVVLKNDIPLLISAIRKINPDCTILFLTLYNPYEAVNTIFRINGMPIEFDSLSDAYVGKINDCLRTGRADAKNVDIVDVYSAFEGRGKELLYAVTPEDLDPYEMNMSYMDPHPNAKGHMVIGRLTADAYRSRH